MNEKWYKDIQDKLKDFQMEAPEGLLDDIRKEMNRRYPVSASSWRRNFFRIASIAAVIALWMGISLLWKDELPVPATESTGLPTLTDAGAPAGQTAVPAGDAATAPPATIAPPAATTHLMARADKTMPSQADTLTTEEEAVVHEEKEAVEKKEEHRPQAKQREEAAPAHKPTQRTYAPSRKRTSAYAISVYYAGFANHNRRTEVAMNFQPSTPPPPNTGDSQAETDTTTTSRNVTAPLPSGLEGNAKHRLPVRIGVSFRYYLNERWYLQSGLTYSYLAADISSVGSSVPYQTKQKLHYIGIPLQAGYRIWESRRFKGYLSIGGQAERLVGGKAHVRYFPDYNKQVTADKDIDDGHLWFSALASFGAEYAPNRNFSLYAEPGIHYYFKNGSKLQTYYRDHPLNFSITLGLRFHWQR